MRHFLMLCLIAGAAMAADSFPSCIGYGCTSTGGRASGALLIKVANLNDDASVYYCEPGSTGVGDYGGTAPFYDDADTCTCSLPFQGAGCTSECAAGYSCVKGGLGTFRRALGTAEARNEGGRTGTNIVFNVGADIVADATMFVRPTATTVYGSTAPGGIAWQGRAVWLKGANDNTEMEDLILRHMSFYLLGDQVADWGGAPLPGNAASNEGTSLVIGGQFSGNTGDTRIVVDHVGTYHGIDSSSMMETCHLCSWINSIAGDALFALGACTTQDRVCDSNDDCSGSCTANGWAGPPSGMGNQAMFVRRSGDVTFARNVVTGSMIRTPRVAETQYASVNGGALNTVEFINNLTYGWKGETTVRSSTDYCCSLKEVLEVDYIGNVFIQSAYAGGDTPGTCDGGTRVGEACLRDEHCPSSTCDVETLRYMLGECGDNSSVDAHFDDNSFDFEGPGVTSESICDPATENCDDYSIFFVDGVPACDDINVRQGSGVASGKIWSNSVVETNLLGGSRDVGPNRDAGALSENGYAEALLDGVSARTRRLEKCPWECNSAYSNCPTDCKGTFGVKTTIMDLPAMYSGLCIDAPATPCNCSDDSDGTDGSGPDSCIDAGGCSTGNCRIRNLDNGWSFMQQNWVDTDGTVVAIDAGGLVDNDSDDDGLADDWEEHYFGDLDETFNTGAPCVANRVGTSWSNGGNWADAVNGGNPTHYSCGETQTLEYLGEMTAPTSSSMNALNGIALSGVSMQ